MRDVFAPVRRGSRAWWAAAALAIVFLLGHLPFLASTLEDVDSVNFALGLRDFDPGRHRPHPPGYPIYMALGKAANLVLGEPRALAVWGALFGALSAFALLRLFAALDALDGDLAASPERLRPLRIGEWLGRPAVAAALTMMAPLFWMTASRPMSDSAGLAASLTAQAILLTAIVRQRAAASAGESPSAASAVQSGRLILLGAFMSAIAIGFRSQAAWLTLPVLALAILDRAGRGAAGALIGSLVWLTAGTLLWFVPLVVASGGPAAYYAAFSAQAGEDWSGVDLLANGFTVRELAFALYDTLVRHWAGAGWLIVALAAIGAAVLLWRGRRALMVIIVAFVPYAVFHLLFQETVTTRYALPLVPAVAYLAVRGLYAPAPVGGLTLAAALAFVLGITIAPVTATYARAGGPVTRALADIRSEAARAPGVAVGMHHPFARPVEAEGVGQAAALPARPKHEWLELVKRWQAGAARPRVVPRGPAAHGSGAGGSAVPDPPRRVRVAVLQPGVPGRHPPEWTALDCHQRARVVRR